MRNSIRLHERTILGAALGLRLIVVGIIAAAYPRDWLYTRGMEMGLLARSLLAGQGLSSPFGVETGPTAFIAPGYPILVAGIFRLFGVYSFPSALAIMLLQVAANVISIWLMMKIASQLFNRGTALLAGWVWACSVPMLFLPTIFWDTSLSACGLLAIIHLVLRIRSEPSRRLWITLGLGCGVLALINPALVLVLAAFTAWAGWPAARGQRSGVVIAVLVALAVFSPWPIRNARVFHAFVPLRTTVGFELWMGNHQGSTGYLDESLFPTFNPHELEDYKQMGEIAYTNHKSELAKTYMLKHPARFLELTSFRVFRFWAGTGTQHGSMLFVLHASITSILGFIGLFLLFRQKRLRLAVLFLIPMLLFPAPYYITHAEFRYRVTLDPVMTLLASYAVVCLSRRYSAGSGF